MNEFIISDPVALKGILEFARESGCFDQFAQDFCRLLMVLTGPMTPESDIKAEIMKDFAPHSMAFAMWRGEKSHSNLMLNGGLIYAGPGAPGDGSAPSLSVDLSWVAGQRPRHSWNIHT
jgi:hypothetical protein